MFEPVILLSILVPVYVIAGVVSFIKTSKYMVDRNIFKEWKTIDIGRKVYLTLLLFFRFVFWLIIFVGFLMYKKKIIEIYNIKNKEEQDGNSNN